MNPSAVPESEVRAREAQLKARHPKLTACRVSIEERPPHRYECRRYNVRLDLVVAGHELVINREHDDDPAAALGAAFEAAGRALRPFQPDA